MRKIIALLVAFALAISMLGFAGGSANAEPGDSASDPIVVANPSEVPAGAVEDEVSTYLTPGKCDTTRSWVLTVPATEDTSHEEFRYKRDVPAVAEESHSEYRWPLEKRTYTPGQDEVKVKVYTKEVREPKYKTVESWEKHVKGYKEKKVNGQWVPDGTFDYRDYPGAGPVPQDGGSGPHNSTWTEGNIRYHSTYFKYVLISSEQVLVGYTDWAPTGEEFEGSPPADTDTVRYIFKEYRVTQEETPAVFGPWTADGFTEWSTNPAAPADPDGESGEDNPLNLRRVGAPSESKTVVDVEAVPGYTEYYVLGGNPSQNEADASWLLAEQAPGGNWVQFDERTVTDSEGTPEVVTYYAWSDGKVCEDTPPPNNPPETPDEPREPRQPRIPGGPGIPFVVDSGL